MIQGQQLMNENYLESKMYSFGFGSFIVLTNKANEFLVDQSKCPIKLYETKEMKEFCDISAKPSTSSGSGFKLNTNANL